jgi:hypothetical protein
VEKEWTESGERVDKVAWQYGEASKAHKRSTKGILDVQNELIPEAFPPTDYRPHGYLNITEFTAYFIVPGCTLTTLDNPFLANFAP